MSGWLPNSSLSHPIRSMISSSTGSFPAGKSVENGSPPGMRYCAGSRAHRKTIHSPRPSNAVIGMSSPLPSNPARRRSRKGKRGCPVCSPFLMSLGGGTRHHGSSQDPQSRRFQARSACGALLLRCAMTCLFEAPGQGVHG
jgi:hypothetical protein